MNEQKNIEIIKRGYDAFGRGDIDGLLSIFDQNIEWETPGPSELATAGKRRGHQQVREFFKAVDDVFEIQRFEPKSFVAQGDQVVVLGEDTARVKATGKVIEEAWAHAFTVKGDKVVRFQEYLDTSSTVAELKAAHARA